VVTNLLFPPVRSAFLMNRMQASPSS
jgi:hypothetical protein